ncbi:tRNA glutamyl-Q(34) synthetase GluQRS [Congregibacter sp.]|uniref:tRNA glutamyl-Q(34) synthetase GluQRS n=1 Tax=Congregibacter sp. TaxID=2744308 RepID=UPI003F6CA850
MALEAVYRGRFAPSPTGPLHMGSLLAAVASYLDARSASGAWLVRVEDIDPPREEPGSADSILRSLEAHGLIWDEAVLYQSSRLEAYREALTRLSASGRVFSCCCTRATLGPGGSCLGRCQPGPQDATTLRVQLRGDLGFEDGFLGAQPPPETASDLVLKRKDGLYAYALAVVVDDAWQNITHVVRGADLLSQTFAQLELLSELGTSLPAYAHLPLVRDSSGTKLSKQSGARGIEDEFALDNLRLALGMLGQDSADLPAGSASELIALATARWNPQGVNSARESALVYP